MANSLYDQTAQSIKDNLGGGTDNGFHPIDTIVNYFRGLYGQSGDSTPEVKRRRQIDQDASTSVSPAQKAVADSIRKNL